MEERDVPVVARWLAEDHVRAWWRDPSDVSHVREKYLPRIGGDEPTEVFIVVYDGQDVGLIQRYRLGAYDDWAKTIAGSGLSFGAAAGIDYFIGEPLMVGRGIGTMAVDAFTDAVFSAYADVEEIVVTPQAANRASCRVLEKAGYELQWTGMLDSDDPSDAGPAALYVRTR